MSRSSDERGVDLDVCLGILSMHDKQVLTFVDGGRRAGIRMVWGETREWFNSVVGDLRLPWPQRRRGATQQSRVTRLPFAFYIKAAFIRSPTFSPSSHPPNSLIASTLLSTKTILSSCADATGRAAVSSTTVELVGMGPIDRTPSRF